MQSPILNGWKEIAKYLQVHIQTAMRLAEEEGLPVSRIGGQVFSSVNAIEAWILKNTNKK